MKYDRPPPPRKRKELVSSLMELQISTEVNRWVPFKKETLKWTLEVHLDISIPSLVSKYYTIPRILQGGVGTTPKQEQKDEKREGRGRSFL